MTYDDAQNALLSGSKVNRPLWGGVFLRMMNDGSGTVITDLSALGPLAVSIGSVYVPTDDDLAATDWGVV